jgi:hypothetical protein
MLTYWDLLQKVQEELMGIPSFETRLLTIILQEKKWLLNWKNILNGSMVRSKIQTRQIHQQLLMAASDILIEIYMAESTI